jgi:hypothetical protein
MPRRPSAAAAILSLLAALGVLAPQPASAQVRPGLPGPDLSAYEAFRRELEAGRETARLTRVESGLPRILMTGYWPPSNEMIRRFSDNAVQNPAGWVGGNWEGRGYDIYSFFPEFPAGPAPGCNWGQGMGDLEVDYQDTSSDFWSIVGQVRPTAIVTFSRGNGVPNWEVELNQHNHAGWFADYTAPTQPTPAPPDSDYPAEGLRCSTLPLQSIVDRVNATGVGLSAYIDYSGDTGDYLSEFMAYHGVWYRALHQAPADPSRTIAAGHVHVGFGACSPSVTPYVLATEETLRTVIDRLAAGQEVPPNMVRARSTGASEITLNWTGTSPWFEVYRAEGGCAGTWLVIGATAATTFVDRVVTTGQTYGYMIRSVDLCTADSDCVGITHSPCDPAALSGIANLSAVKGASGAIDLAWDPDPALPPEYHVNSVAAKAQLVAPNRGQPGVTSECTVATTSCSDPDPAESGIVHYQVLSACSDVAGEEGPI